MTQTIIERTVDFVKQTLQGAEAGHDWFHIERVWKLSTYLARETDCNEVVVALGALLHDIADAKFHNGNEDIGPDMALQFLNKEKVDPSLIDQVIYIIRNISFKNRNEVSAHPIELQIVQDADRLDAIGAIGIARTFNFGGYKNNPMYDPDVPANLNLSKEAYKRSNGTTINHFYEKLLLLKDMMHTESARKIAEERHRFMLTFLEEFYKEWNVAL
ncbi:phosphohydrolase [Taibaiella sp. KBW10]|uniref:HD domain-containing protein n=1 Tax=Taibaiella sp. KBW10 TaxID=2153357 RepID=UPI000F5A24F0|nr:HD domain-containing protein [Taibaiella sp. KBW10]RQO31311.1 phosphohydrolase [Taibaiella sp. KBW10]